MTSDDTAAKMQSLLYEFNQMINVFKTQMRLYSKRKRPYIFIALAVLIPILAYSGVAKTILSAFSMTPSISYLLILLPLLLPVITAMLAGKVISSEYKNRTAYIMLSLPVSRTTFFLGKFLAALVLSIGVFSLAYGFAIIAGAGLYEPSYPQNMASSLVVCIAAVFALVSMACGLSPYFKRGSTNIVIALMVFLPVILLLIIGAYFGETSSLLNIRVLPMFSGYSALLFIDAGVGGLYVELFQAISGGYEAIAYVTASIVWGILFLTLGLLKVRKKEL